MVLVVGRNTEMVKTTMRSFISDKALVVDDELEVEDEAVPDILADGWRECEFQGCPVVTLSRIPVKLKKEGFARCGPLFDITIMADGDSSIDIHGAIWALRDKVVYGHGQFFGLPSSYWTQLTGRELACFSLVVVPHSARRGGSTRSARRGVPPIPRAGGVSHHLPTPNSLTHCSYSEGSPYHPEQEKEDEAHLAAATLLKLLKAQPEGKDGPLRMKGLDFKNQPKWEKDLFALVKDKERGAHAAIVTGRPDQGLWNFFACLLTTQLYLCSDSVGLISGPLAWHLLVLARSRILALPRGCPDSVQ
jgi:hypothetical protein